MGYDGAGAPASSRTCSESCLLVGLMILASTRCRSTSSLAVLAEPERVISAAQVASHRWPIRDEAISSGPRVAQPEVQFSLPSHQPLSRSGFRCLQFGVVVCDRTIGLGEQPQRKRRIWASATADQPWSHPGADSAASPLQSEVPDDRSFSVMGIGPI